MYLKVRKLGAIPGENDLIINISKMALIQELRDMVFQELDVEINKQRLFYKGKQLIDDHRVMDYDIQLNDVVQLMIRTELPSIESKEKSAICDSKEDSEMPSCSEKSEVKADSKYYKVGDLIDVRDVEYGAWFEAKILDVLHSDSENNGPKSAEDSGISFRIKNEIDDEIDPFTVTFDDIRPRSRYTYKLSELTVGKTVLANYNIEEPKSRGYWYDFEITDVSSKSLKGTILVGKEKTPLKNCSIKFIDEVMKIEEPILIADRSDSETDTEAPVRRKNPYRCTNCKDVSTRKCKECGCRICSGKEKPGTIILCDECDYGYHIACLSPPLTEIPTDPEWYCPSCKTDENEIVQAGDKLKFSSKKAKMASAKEDASTRDWGRGMACVGRTKECTIVPKDHYGPVPGVEVGTCWKFRLQASEAGIHRPHVAGIHGRETDGAYSLVLSGGYEDDVDDGKEFLYTGSGGRDLSGNKRVSEQSCDQTLTRMNKALALNCNVKFNPKDGAEAEDWKGGKPVRVVRNYKLGKHSKYAPQDGNRYDGLYKVVKYYPQKGKSGFIVWRYMLRRDDPTPPPWAKNGQELEMVYPPGYLEAQAEKEKKSDTPQDKKRGSKRVLVDTTNSPSPKKPKVKMYSLSKEQRSMITADSDNEKLWSECKEVLGQGKQKFLKKVEELFVCICCQEIVYMPITTECKHNICQGCLKRSFSSEIFCCPYCRFDLGKNYEMKVNKHLADVLQNLFPGYEAGR